MFNALKILLFISSIVFTTSLYADIEIEPTPINMADFTCDKFKEKSNNCEAYTCQTPYNQDPTIKTEWKIVGKNNDRCIISNTTSDMGLKDANDNPKPVTKSCEYDQTGIENLNNMMSDMQAGYFSSPADNTDGVFNCKFTSNGQPINPTSYNVSSDLD